MKKRSGRPSRSPEAPGAQGRPVMHLEGLEDRRMMSIVSAPDANNLHTAVRLETNLGRITLLLTPDATPLTVQNFLNNYVDKKLYDNTIVHRSIEDFVVQLGGFKLATGYPHIDTTTPVDNEFQGAQAAAGGGKVNVRGTVAMAKVGGDPNSATSEFFFNLADNSGNLDGQNGGFTTFARVIGGGMHVVDAIAGLPTMNLSSQNSALTDLPVIQTATGTNPIVVSSAKAQASTVVRVGDKQTKFVTWIDEKGGTATISLSHGTADLTFVGGNDLKPIVQGNRIIITGNNVELEEITTKNTSKSSVLAIKSVGGNGPAHIGNITVTGNKGLGRIDANTIQIQGDITAANSSINNIDFQGTYRSTILTNGGTLSVKIGTAVDTSINTSGTTNQVNKPGGTIKSLIAQTWVDDGQLDNMSIVTGKLQSMEVNGNFSSNVQVAGDVGLIKINGNIGTRGTSTWTVGGSVNRVQTGKVMGLKLSAIKNIADFRAREVLSSDDGSATIVAAGSIGRMTMATLTNQSTISASAGIQSISISGLMDSSSIQAGNNIGTINVGSITGNAVNAARTALVTSRIYAGVNTTATGLVTAASAFKNKTSTIGRINVQKTFSNAAIAAPIVNEANLGAVQAANFTGFGVTARERIGQVNGTVKGKIIAIRNATTQDQVDAQLEARGLPTFPPNKQGNGYRFNVLVV